MLVTVTVAALAAPLTPQSDPLFDAVQSRHRGSRDPFALLDANGDGALDVAYAVPTADEVEVLFGDGRGRFVPGSVTPCPFSAQEGTTLSADLDGDGEADLVAVGYGDPQVLLGRGDGTFQAPTAIPGAPASNRAALADTNGDGALDLVFPWSALTVALGDGAGGFLAPTVAAAGFFASDLATGDFDGDGIVDVATTAAAPEVQVFLGVGDGTFTHAGTVVAGSGLRRIVAADLDGDGDLDLAAADSPGQRVVLALGQGDGTFVPAPAVPVGTSVLDIATVDMDLDGTLDLALTTSTSRRIVVVPGLGGGAFGTPAGSPSPERTEALGAADLDLDGFPDLLVTQGTYLVFHRGAGRDGLRSGAALPVQSEGWQSRMTDADGDGHLDVLFLSRGSGTSNGTIWRFLGDGAGGVSASPAVSAGLGAFDMDCRDVDGDGAVDLVVGGSTPNRLTVLDGASAYAPVASIPLPASPWRVLTGDVTGDGLPDLVAFTTGPAGVHVAPQLAAGGFGPATSIASGSAPRDVELADLNGDGILDVICPTDAEEVVTFLALGAGAFAPPLALPTPGERQNHVRAADLDGDGLVDLALFSIFRGRVTLVHGNGDGTFTPLGGPLDVVDSVLAPIAADVTGDGLVDLLWVRNSLSGFSVLPGRGDGTFEPVERHASATATRCIAAGDLDGDGFGDVAVGGQFPEVRVHRNLRPRAGDPIGYCRGKVSSTGVPAELGWSGAPSLTTNDLTLEVSGAPPSQFGLLFHSEAGPDAAPFLGGLLCTRGPIVRGPVQALGSTGTTSYPVPVTPAMVGSTRWYQFWHRDPLNPDGTGVALSAGLQVHFRP